MTTGPSRTRQLLVGFGRVPDCKITTSSPAEDSLHTQTRRPLVKLRPAVNHQRYTWLLPYSHANGKKLRSAVNVPHWFGLLLGPLIPLLVFLYLVSHPVIPSYIHACYASLGIAFQTSAAPRRPVVLAARPTSHVQRIRPSDAGLGGLRAAGPCHALSPHVSARHPGVAMCACHVSRVSQTHVRHARWNLMHTGWRDSVARKHGT